jgi:DNA-binding XRE family transcriptional regulator
MGDRNDRIMNARLAKGWTKTDLAKKADVSTRTIDRAENGDKLTEATKHKIANALNMQVGDLFPR